MPPRADQAGPCTGDARTTQGCDEKSVHRAGRRIQAALRRSDRRIAFRSSTPSDQGSNRRRGALKVQPTVFGTKFPCRPVRERAVADSTELKENR
jgi:hypothetical protein